MWVKFKVKSNFNGELRGTRSKTESHRKNGGSILRFDCQFLVNLKLSGKAQQLYFNSVSKIDNK